MSYERFDIDFSCGQQRHRFSVSSSVSEHAQNIDFLVHYLKEWNGHVLIAPSSNAKEIVMLQHMWAGQMIT